MEEAIEFTQGSAWVDYGGEIIDTEELFRRTLEEPSEDTSVTWARLSISPRSESPALVDHLLQRKSVQRQIGSVLSTPRSVNIDDIDRSLIDFRDITMTNRENTSFAIEYCFEGVVDGDESNVPQASNEEHGDSNAGAVVEKEISDIIMWGSDEATEAGSEVRPQHNNLETSNIQSEDELGKSQETPTISDKDSDTDLESELIAEVTTGKETIDDVDEPDTMMGSAESNVYNVDFLVSGTPIDGHKIKNVNNKLLERLGRTIGTWTELITRKKIKITWDEEAEQIWCVNNRLKKYDLSMAPAHKDTDHKTACTKCIRLNVLCVLVPLGCPPVVLPLPVEDRLAGVTPAPLHMV